MISRQHLRLWKTLTAAEAEVLEAICDCLIPSDESGRVLKKLGQRIT